MATKVYEGDWCYFAAKLMQKGWVPTGTMAGDDEGEVTETMPLASLHELVIFAAELPSDYYLGAVHFRHATSRHEGTIIVEDDGSVCDWHGPVGSPFKRVCNQLLGELL